ncbi:MAG TPA: sulfotransferase, partial [Anaerolineales bacterium]|nr:sulfotransferase [Anaerolineales bacterium]
MVGPPRSGTTLIYSLIAGESFLPECTFVSTLMKVFDETYKFEDDERFKYFGHTLANLVEIFKKPINDLLYTAALKVDGVSTNRFIYKDPMLTLYLGYFPLFFGDSYKVVFCVRDPRDTIASMFNVLKKKNSEEDADALFGEAIDFIWPFYRIIYQLDEKAADIDRDKLIFVKYEDLVTGNPETVQALERFLGTAIDLHSPNENIQDRLDETSPFFSENYGKPVTTRPVGKYRDSLTFDQTVRIEHVFSYYMDRLGYERIGERGFSRFEPQKNYQQISHLQRELQKNQQQIFNLQRELQKSMQQLQKSRQELSSLKLDLHQSQQQTSSLQLDLQKGRQEISSLQLNLQKSQQEVTSLNSTL